MEEALTFSKLKIPLDSLFTILSDFRFFAKIRYKKDLNLQNPTDTKEIINNKNNIFDFFKKNLEDKSNFNLFKKEKNIFDVENSQNSYFNSEYYYYTSNESISQIENNKKQNEFFSWFENFFINFKMKVFEFTKDENRFYNTISGNFVENDYKIHKSRNDKECERNNALSDNYLKIIKKNIASNHNQINNSINYKVNKEKNGTRKFFMFLENNTKDNKYEEFIRNQKQHEKFCFDYISSKCNKLQESSTNKILLVIKSETEFKSFFNELIIENKSTNNENSKAFNNELIYSDNHNIINYNLSTIKTNEHKENLKNVDFFRVNK